MNISIESSIKQMKYCLANNLTMKAPSNGKCPNCGKNIYTDYERMVGGISQGYTIEEASNQLIKQCPHCMCIFEKGATK